MPTKKQIIPFEPSTLENIDKAVYKFVNETINPHAITNKGYVKVPVLWLGTERPYQIKHDKALRDKIGKLKLPLITITRTNVVRDELMGSYRSYYPAEQGVAGGSVHITRLLQQEKTRNWANTQRMRLEKDGFTGRIDNKRKVYETITIPKPTYVTCMFEVNIRTEYQQQMNQLIPPFVIDQKNIFPLTYNGYKYELFIQDDYGLSNNLANLASDERMFTAKIQFKVLGYLIGDGINRDRPSISRQQNIVQIVIVERTDDDNEIPKDTNDIGDIEGIKDTEDNGDNGGGDQGGSEGGRNWDGYYGLGAEGFGDRKESNPKMTEIHTSGSFRRY